MHKDIHLDIPHVTSAQLYVEDEGRWVLHVWTELSSAEETAVSNLRRALEGLIGRRTGYDACDLHLKDSVDATRP
jgi:hypothetical protein